MGEQANTRPGIAARVRAIHSGAAQWWAVKHPGLGWQVTSRERGHTPIEARDGARYSMIVGPFNTRRTAHGARQTMKGEG